MPKKIAYAPVAAALALLALAATSLFIQPRASTTATTSIGSAVPDRAESLLYVANGAEGEVTVINTTSSSVLQQVIVRADVQEVALDSSADGSFMYFTDVQGNNFITLNAPTGKIYGTYPSAPGTLSVTSYPPGGYVYVISSLSHSVSIVDSHDHKELNRDFLHKGTFQLGVDPLYAVFTPDLRFWYTDGNTSSVGVVTVSAEVTAIAPWVVDVNVTTLAQIPMPSTPGHIATADGGAEVLVGVQDGLVVLNSSNYKVIAQVSLPDSPNGILASPNDGSIFISSQSGVYVLDPHTFQVTKTLEMNGGAYGLAISPDGATLYVSNPTSGTVTVVDALGLKLVDAIAVGGTPMGICLYTTGGGN